MSTYTDALAGIIEGVVEPRAGDVDRQVGAGVLAGEAVVEELEELAEFGLEFADLRYVHARPSVNGGGEHTSATARGSRQINLALSY